MTGACGPYNLGGSATSVLDMFHQMEVLVNDLKALGEKVEDKDFSHSS